MTNQESSNEVIKNVIDWTTSNELIWESFQDEEDCRADYRAVCNKYVLEIGVQDNILIIWERKENCEELVALEFDILELIEIVKAKVK